MLETVIITTILLVVFLCLRSVLDGKISARLQYGIWLLIALRLLLVWLPLPGSNISVMNLLPVVQDSFGHLKQDVSGEKSGELEQDAGQKIGVSQTDRELSQEDALINNVDVSQDMEEQAVNNSAQSGQEQSLKSESAGNGNGSATTLPALLYRTYRIGIVILLLWLSAKNIRIWNGLRKRRIRYEGDLPVASLPGNLYLIDHLKSPFLFGRHIYVSPEMVSDQQKLRHILIHESCHWKQGDSFWSVLRCLCLALYWYQPLVWYGVRLSIVDAELACDERVIRVLGEESSRSYGETLLGLIRKQAVFMECTCVSTRMSGNKRETKKRLERIMERKKERRGRILFLVVSMLILCLATLPGGKMKNNAKMEKEWKRVEQEGFPCIVVDEQGNIVGTRRGELLQKVILDYVACEGGDFHNYQIQANAFSACTNLKTLILPEQNTLQFVIDGIDPDAFRGCSKDLVVYCDKGCYAWTRLQELNITVKEIPDGTFKWRLLGENRAALKKIQEKVDSEKNNSTVTDREMRQFYGEPFFMMTESGQVANTKCESLSEYTSDRKIYLPADANTLAAGTFANYLMLEQSIMIPKNIVAIEDSSFSGCQLPEVTFEKGSNLQSIGNSAFMDAKLTEIQLPDRLQEIGERAFDTCNNLIEVTIPESVNTLGSNCFSLCSSLERVVILNPNITLGEDVFDDEILDPNLEEGEIDMNDLDSNFVPNYRLTIVCHKGSTAEKYAREHGLQVEYLE